MLTRVVTVLTAGSYPISFELAGVQTHGLPTMGELVLFALGSVNSGTKN